MKSANALSDVTHDHDAPQSLGPRCVVDLIAVSSGRWTAPLCLSQCPPDTGQHVLKDAFLRTGRSRQARVCV